MAKLFTLLFVLSIGVALSSADIQGERDRRSIPDGKASPAADISNEVGGPLLVKTDVKKTVTQLSRPVEIDPRGGEQPRHSEGGREEPRSGWEEEPEEPRYGRRGLEGRRSQGGRWDRERPRGGAEEPEEGREESRGDGEEEPESRERPQVRGGQWNHGKPRGGERRRGGDEPGVGDEEGEESGREEQREGRRNRGGRRDREEARWGQEEGLEGGLEGGRRGQEEGRSVSEEPENREEPREVSREGPVVSRGYEGVSPYGGVPYYSKEPTTYKEISKTTVHKPIVPLFYKHIYKYIFRKEIEHHREMVPGPHGYPVPVYTQTVVVRRIPVLVKKVPVYLKKQEPVLVKKVIY